MPIRLTTVETINIEGHPQTATHVELVRFKVITGDRVSNPSAVFTMQYGNMIDPGDGSGLRFEGVAGAERTFARRVIPEDTVHGQNIETGEMESVTIPEDNQITEIMSFMGLNPSVIPDLEASLAAGLAASEDEVALRARVQTIMTGQGISMVYVGVYTWLLVKGHFSGTPE